MVTPDVEKHLKELPDVKTIVLFGIEVSDVICACQSDEFCCIAFYDI